MLSLRHNKTTVAAFLIISLIIISGCKSKPYQVEYEPPDTSLIESDLGSAKDNAVTVEKSADSIEKTVKDKRVPGDIQNSVVLDVGRIRQAIASFVASVTSAQVQNEEVGEGVKDMQKELEKAQQKIASLEAKNKKLYKRVTTGIIIVGVLVCAGGIWAFIRTGKLKAAAAACIAFITIVVSYAVNLALDNILWIVGGITAVIIGYIIYEMVINGRSLLEVVKSFQVVKSGGYNKNVVNGIQSPQTQKRVSELKIKNQLNSNPP
jgi:hypothetical protein